MMVENELEDYERTGDLKSWFTRERFLEYMDRHFLHTYSFNLTDDFDDLNIWCKQNFEHSFCLSINHIRCKSVDDLFKFKLRV